MKEINYLEKPLFSGFLHVLDGETLDKKDTGKYQGQPMTIKNRQKLNQLILEYGWNMEARGLENNPILRLPYFSLGYKILEDIKNLLDSCEGIVPRNKDNTQE